MVDILGPMAALEPGRQLPSFRLKDLDGKIRTREELSKGGGALLIFYHRECPVCQFSAPFFGAIARAMGSSTQVRVWGVSQDPEEESEEFARRNDLRMPILIDEDPYPVSNACGITNVPTLFLIDNQGKIARTCVGFAKDDFSKIAEQLASKAGVKPPDLFAGRSDIPALKPG